MRSMRPLPHFLLRRVTIFGGDAGSARASAPPGVVAFGRRECRTSRQLEDRRSGGPLFLAAVRLVGPLRGLPSGAPSIRYQSRTRLKRKILFQHSPSALGCRHLGGTGQQNRCSSKIALMPLTALPDNTVLRKLLRIPRHFSVCDGYTRVE